MSLGAASPWNIFPFSALTLLVGRQEGHPACKKLDVGLLVIIWLELCTTYSSSCHHQLCLWPLITPGYLGWGLPCLSSALWCQYLTLMPVLLLLLLLLIPRIQHNHTKPVILFAKLILPILRPSVQSAELNTALSNFNSFVPSSMCHTNFIEIHPQLVFVVIFQNSDTKTEIQTVSITSPQLLG